MNLESDVQNASQGYLIERSLDDGLYQQIATVGGTTTEYIDYTVSGAGSGPNLATYKIRSKDTQGFMSLYTEPKTINWGDIWKTNAQNESITDFNLDQNYPNPFNPSTTFNYSIPQETNVEIAIYDLLGTKLETIRNEKQPAGNYEITWNANNYPSGVYFYQMKAGTFTSAKKMLLMK